MGSPVTTAKWLDATNTFAAAADAPIFGEDDVVYRITDFPAPSVAQGAAFTITLRPYSVVRPHEMIDVLLGADELLDQTKSTATPADGSTARTPADFPVGFNHTASPVGTTATTVTSRPWFYQLSNVDTGEVVTGVHQCLITNKAGIETYIAANIAGWLT